MRTGFLPAFAGAIVALALHSGAAADCASKPGLAAFASDAWGIDARSTRFQPQTAITAANVGRLKLKWAYGFSNDMPRSYPLVTDDTIFLGDAGHGVVALNRKNGCTRWTFAHRGLIGSAILHETRGNKTTLLPTIDQVIGIDGATEDEGIERFHRVQLHHTKKV